MGAIFRWHDGGDIWHLDEVGEDGEARMIADNIVGEDRAKLFEDAANNTGLRAELAAARERAEKAERELADLRAQANMLLVDARTFSETMLRQNREVTAVESELAAARDRAQGGWRGHSGRRQTW